MPKKGHKIIQKDILGHLGHLFSTYARIEKDLEDNIYKDSKNAVPSVPTTEPPTLLEDILSMPLSQFKEAGLLCRVRCGNLGGEDVFIASSEKEAEVGKSEGLIVYTGDELIQLVKGKPSPDELRMLHDLKKIFGGMLTETREGREINATN